MKLQVRFDDSSSTCRFFVILVVFAIVFLSFPFFCTLSPAVVSSSSLPSSQRTYRDINSNACPRDWKYYKKHCYKAFLSQNESLQWFEAETKCNIAARGRDGHLVSILDENEMSTIHNWIVNEWKAPIFDAIYIGLIDAAKEGVYRWSDNNPMSYTDWAPASSVLNSEAQPDGGAFEDCTVIILDQMNHTQNWHDIPCTLGKHGHLKTSLPFHKYNLNGSFYQFIDSIDSYICKMDASIVKNTRPPLRTTPSPLGDHQRNSSHYNLSDGQTYGLAEPLYNDYLESFNNQQYFFSLNSSRMERTFICKNLEVISIVFRCDGLPNCRDGSDEEDCPGGSSCLPSQFRCANSKCVAISAYCDFVDDCGDGSDERFCDRRMCKHSSEFKCLNGQCVPSNKRCDLLNDCKDGSDEVACTSGSYCNPNTTFQCYYGNCIPLYAVCDKHRDCPGKFYEDEQPARCDPRTFQRSMSTTNYRTSPAAMPRLWASQNSSISTGVFECQSGQIIDKSYLCIYDFDQYGYQIGCRDVSHLRKCESFKCPHPEYIKCPNSYCIPPRFICDGKWDCIGGADEKGCARYYCPGQYKCSNSSSCTLLSHLCDGVRHCQQGDDEWFCDLSCPDSCTCSGMYVSCRSLGLTKLPEGVSKKVKKLDLSFNLLGHEMFSSSSLNEGGFSAYEELGELILQSNNITILQPRKFLRLKNLYKLDLRYNNILIIKASAFAGLRRVTHLLLDHNENLSVIEPEAFVGLTALLHLNISHARITQISENTFWGLNKLQSLEFTFNGLRHIKPGAFRGLEALGSLDMQGNTIVDFPRDMFQGLRQLRHLSTDSFKFCCLASHQIPFDRCLPPADEISDCEDLMSSVVQRSFLWILGVIASFANIAVICKRISLSFLNKQKHSLRWHSDKVSSTLIISLGCADFLMGIYLLIIASVDVYYRGHYIEKADEWKASWVCKLCGFLSTLSTEASVFTLVFITIDRLLCICFTLADYKFTMKTTYRVIVISWITAFLMSFLPFVVKPYFHDEFYARSGVCLALHLTNTHPAGWEYSVAIFLFTNFIAFLFIFLAYVFMYRKVRSARRQTRIMARQVREINTGKKMAAIVLTNFICWFPVIIMGIIAMSGVNLSAAVYSWTAVFVLPFNSALNPIIYTISHYGFTNFIRPPTAMTRDSITGRVLNLTNASVSTNRRTIKEVRHHRPPYGFITLNQWIKDTRPIDIRHILQISSSLAEEVEHIHANGMALGGGINIFNVFVSTKVDRYMRVYIPETGEKVPPSRQCNEYAEDVMEIGKIIASLLRIYKNQFAETAENSSGREVDKLRILQGRDPSTKI